MRYRLRTLLIVMTVACMYLAWVAYCRRMSGFHREQSSLLISIVAKREGFDRESIELTMSELFDRWPQQAVEAARAAPKGDGHWEAVYSSAVAHESIARKFDCAVWRPWALISD